MADTAALVMRRVGDDLDIVKADLGAGITTDLLLRSRSRAWHPAISFRPQDGTLRIDCLNASVVYEVDASSYNEQDETWQMRRCDEARVHV